MKLLTGLFRFARKRTQTTDNDMGMFRDKLNELVEQKETLSDEDVSAKVEELKAMSADLPDEEEKAKLDRFLEDFKSVKEQDAATAKEAAGLVADLFEKLDTQAMKDVPDVGSEEAADAEPDSLGSYVKKNVEADIDHMTQTHDEDEEEVAEETVEETTAPEGESNAEYTLEEIYQFIKKRMAEDAEADAGSETEESTEEETETEEEVSEDSAEEIEEEQEEKEEEVTTDHAPRIPVTIGETATTGTLAEMFANLKKGGR